MVNILQDDLSKMQEKHKTFFAGKLIYENEGDRTRATKDFVNIVKGQRGSL